MSTLESGNQATAAVAGTLQAQIDPTYWALRTAHRPLDVNTGGKTLGHYRVFTPGNAAGAIANGIQNSLRYTGANTLVVTRVWAIVTTTTAVTVQTITPLLCYVVRSFTVGDTTNGTAATLSATGSNSMKTGSGSIGVGISIYNATAPATVLSGGTGTQDSQPFGAMPLGSSVALGIIGTNVVGDLYNAGVNLYCAPLTLQANEGIRVLWGTTLATGTATLGVGYDLSEVAAF